MFILTRLGWELKKIVLRQQFYFSIVGMIMGWSPSKVVQIVPDGCILWSRGYAIGFKKMDFSNTGIFLSKVLDLVYNTIYKSATKVAQIMPPVSKMTPP